jgi:GlpG protein
MDARAWDGQLWRLPASALPHLGLMHLAFNLYWLWALGTAVEAALGRGPFAFTVLLLAAGPAAAEYAVGVSGVGLSGVCYGLFGLALVLGRRDARLAGVVTGRTVALFAGWFAVCWALTASGKWQASNMAHAAGALFGLLLGAALAARHRPRAAVAAALATAVVLALVGAVVRTPRPEELAYLGYLDLEAGRDGRGADRLGRAVAADPGQADWWRNLGLARQRVGQPGAAAEAYRAALRLRPQDPEVRAALAGILANDGYARHVAGDLRGAVELYREAVATDDRSAATWYNLGLAYRGLGRDGEAREAFRRAGDLDPADPSVRAALAEEGAR